MQSPIQSSSAVTHINGACRFEAHTAHGVAELCYDLAGDLMRITHTEVPHALRGQGWAAQLVAAALQLARQQGWRVRPSCSYARVYMQRHPETQDLLA